MKKLIFIDNDGSERATLDCKNYITPFLEAYGGLDEAYCSNIEIISDLYKRDKNELYDTFFSKQNAIISWSVYTPTSEHNSKQQFIHFLRVAGSANVSTGTYIDMTGMAKEALISTLRDIRTGAVVDILKGVGLSNIISLVDAKFYRLIVDFTTPDFIYKKLIDLKECLSN